MKLRKSIRSYEMRNVARYITSDRITNPNEKFLWPSISVECHNIFEMFVDIFIRSYVDLKEIMLTGLVSMEIILIFTVAFD